MEKVKKDYFNKWKEKLSFPENLQFNVETLEPERNTIIRLSQLQSVVPELFDCNKHNNSDKETSILDVGCNKGFFSFWFSKHYDNVIGCDLHKESIKFAAELQAYHKINNIHFLNIPFNQLSNELKFDIVFFGQCTHHMIKTNLIDLFEKQTPLSFLNKAKEITKRYIIIDGAFSLNDPTVKFDCKKYKFNNLQQDFYLIHSHITKLLPEFKLIRYNWSGDGATRNVAVFERIDYNE